MTASVDALRGRVARLRDRLAKQGAPRTWFLCLESAEKLPAAVEAKFRPEDEVFIREYPAEYFGVLFDGVTGSSSIGTVMTPGGAFIVYPDGRLEKVVRQ